MKTKFTLSLITIILIAVSSMYAHCANEVVFRTSFDSFDELKSWVGIDHLNVHLVNGYKNTQSLLIERGKQEGVGSFLIRLPLPVDKLRGTLVRFEAMVKTVDVKKPLKPWNGVKFMLKTVAPDGTHWSQQDNVYGTFDWKQLEFNASLPQDTTEAWLIIGVEETTGMVFFDDINVVIEKSSSAGSYKGPSGPIYTGHPEPRLRGAMIGSNVTAEDLNVLGVEWNANQIRWQLNWLDKTADKTDMIAYGEWLEKSLCRLDKLLPTCKEAGIKVVIDLHTPPGGSNSDGEMRLFKDKKYQEKFLSVWASIANRYKDNESVWGYDLVNEPNERGRSRYLLDYYSLVTKVAQTIRAIDLKHAIIVEAGEGAKPSGFIKLEPIDVAGVVYSAHMYLPHNFTHQGVDSRELGLEYPGKIDGEMWDKNKIRRTLKPIIDFQRKYNAQIYIGEFSAIRWAPQNSAYNYLKDLTDIFEENGWDWSYHAFREWHGWSVEHGQNINDNTRSKSNTDRESLLKLLFSNNVKSIGRLKK